MPDCAKKILSFDGGGIRGVISIIFLQALEKETNVSLSAAADVLTGTSTGSITAGSLAVGFTPGELIEFYLKCGQDIFTPSSFLADHSPLRPKYSSQGLHQTLETVYQARGVDPQITLDQIDKKIIIPAVNLNQKATSQWQLELLHNLTLPSSPLKLIDAIMRSTAAPSYFPSYQNYIDGGIGANDPSAPAYALYQSHLPAPTPPVYLLSFGTGYTSHFIPKGEDWGSFSWVIDVFSKKEATTTPLLSVIFDVQQELSTELSKLLLGDCFHRIDLPLTKPIKLDDASQISKLIQMTQDFIAANQSLWNQACAFVEKNFS
ncbi:MAG: patatin-like phospholipase family protein [Chlamydiota bacterium]